MKGILLRPGKVPIILIDGGKSLYVVGILGRSQCIFVGLEEIEQV